MWQRKYNDVKKEGEEVKKMKAELKDTIDR